MAIIYSYPDNLNILLTDMLIGTSTIKVAGKKKNITKNFTVEALGKVISTANPTVWGTIIGNLNDQTDLQAALDSKQNNITLTTIGSNGPSTLIGSVLNIPNYFTVVPTKTSELINDGEDGVHPFITAADVTPQVNSDWNATSGVAEILNKPIIPTKTSDLTNDGEDGINPFITLADIPPSTIPNLNDVLLEGNTSQLDAKIGSLYLYDTTAVDYARVDITNDIFAVTLASNNPLFQNGIGVSRVWNSIGVEGVIDYSLLTGGRIYSMPDASGTIALTSDIPAQGLTSVGLSMPAAFNVANSPLTSDGTIAVSAAGTSSQYIRGDGQLATLPSGSGGGSTVAYYLNGSINASVAGYKQLSNTATIGGGTDFTLVGNGLIAQFLTDIGNPNRLEIPGGAWNFEMFFQASSAGGSQKFYVELLKYDGTTFTSIASSVPVAEEITGGTTIDLYLTSLAVPTTPLLVTDRLAIRVYIVDNSGGRTITLHTEDNTLCEIITTFSGGVTSLNGLTANTQYLAVGTTGTDFNISSLVDTHTFNLPTASATNRGALTSTDWTTFNGKFNLPSLTSGSVLFSNGTTIAQKNSNFFWDNTNNRLGIGTTAPSTSFEILKSSTFSGQLGSLMLRSDVTSTKKMYFGFDDTKNYGYLQSVNTGVAFLTTAINPNGGITLIGSSTANGTANLQAYTSTDGIITTFGRVGGTKNSQLSFYGYETGEVQLRYTGSSGDQYLTFFSNGAERMRLANNGNLLINTTTDNGGKLQIKAPGALSTDIALRVRNSADTGDLMNIQGDGRINFNSALAIGSNNFYSSGENRTRFYSTAQTTDNLQIYTNGGAYGSSYGEIGYLFKNTATQMASINFDTRTSVAPFRFFVNPTGASAIDAMDIFRTGEVGIGTSNTNIGGKLQIKAPGALSTDIALRVRNSADTADLMTVAGNGNTLLNSSTLISTSTYPLQVVGGAGGSALFSNSLRTQALNINLTTVGETRIYSDYFGAGVDQKIILGTFANRANQLVLNTNGNVLINTTTDNGGKLQIKAPGALSTDIALRVRNSADTGDLATIGGTGILTVGGTGNAGTINLARASNGGIMGAIIQPSDFTEFYNYQGSGFRFYVASTSNLVRAFITTRGLGITGTTGNQFTLDASALLQGDSTTQGFLPPRMTTTQKNAIATPASGLIVYDTTLGKLCVRGASAWETITSV